MNKKNKLIILIITLITIIILGGLTYAYFTANDVSGNSTTNTIVTLTADYGNIIVTYDDSKGIINANDINLLENEKGQNLNYLLKFNIENTGNVGHEVTVKWKEVLNTFCQYANNQTCTDLNTDTYVGDEIKYNLYNCNLTDYTNETINNCTNIGSNAFPLTGEKTKLTTDEYINLPPTSKTYYILTMTIENKDVEQNYNQGKSFSGRIDVQLPKTLARQIVMAHPPISDAIASTYVTSATGIDFATISSPTNGQGLYINDKENVVDDPTIGTIKYFRGGNFCAYSYYNLESTGTRCTNAGGSWLNNRCSLHDSKSICESKGFTYYELKNNVMFAGFDWKIIRINADGSIRMIYNGTTPTAKGANAQIVGTYTYNSTSAMDTGSGPSNPSENETALEYATYDNGAIEAAIHSWYTANLVSYSSYIVDSDFCSDMTYIAGSAWPFGAYNRLEARRTPTFNCPQVNDIYTLADGKLASSTALITADEMSYAGGVWGTNNFTYYLQSGSSYWTMSPSQWMSSGFVFAWHIEAAGGARGYNTGGVGYSHGGRPVINLKGDSTIKQGIGTLSDPWVIE